MSLIKRMSPDEKKESGVIALCLMLLILAHFIPKNITIVLYIVTYIISAYPILKEAIENIFHGKWFDENFLMSVATVGALAIGQFSEAIAVMLFYRVGEIFEDLAIENSKKSITNLLDIRPEYANLELNGKLQQVKPELLNKGDIIIVNPGEKIAVDGVVESGEAYLNTAALTGETKPLLVTKDSQVLSGMIVENSALRIRVSKEYKDSTVVKILELVQNASEKKTKTENFITKFSQIYTPVIVISAIMLASIPPLFLGQEFQVWLYRALIFLVISCPCALVISIPLSYFGGIGASSRAGILVKGSNYLEALSQAKAVIFDKTGTLTRGEFFVTQIIPANGVSKKEIVKLAAIAESSSPHPIARSIVKNYPGNIARVSNVEELVGLGVRAEYQGDTISVGNMKLMNKLNIDGVSTIEDTTGTVVYVALNNEYLGAIEVSDMIKIDAKAAIQGLKNIGIDNVTMLTGDKKIVGKSVAEKLAIPNVRTELLPQDKVTEVEKIKSEIADKGKVIFVGDGLNDTPVLASADVGVAMGALGSDAAVEVADVVLMKDNPTAVTKAIKIARKTKIIVWENIIFALVVKVIFLLIGALGIATMWEAVFADVGVTFIAILNALRLLKIKEENEKINKHPHSKTEKYKVEVNEV
ncbi:heavy metal translocating P-type ATPase [Ligilactobacillus salivarius]|uniref:heavy metal translocating P-type ATPase n=1 Tax=Ligilactobacillus salivarius TaxID=1624 RepID=UPI00189BB8B9|nr:heavy metal translocating P-type ATPase [Ligilactobacillus salivarius]